VSEDGSAVSRAVVVVNARPALTERPPLVSEVTANFCGQRDVVWKALRNLHGRNLDFQNRSRYFFFQAAPQLYSRG
jgi:hypothetical protein